MKMRARLFLGFVLGTLWVLAYDGAVRVFTGAAAPPTFAAALTALGSSLFVGAVLGCAAAGLLAAAGATGPAGGATTSVLKRLSDGPWWAAPVATVAFAVPVAAVVPLRSLLMETSLYATAAIDLAGLAAGWGAAAFIAARLSKNGAGRRLSRRTAGAGLAVLAAALAAGLAARRPELEVSDLWDLVLVAQLAIATGAFALLLPEALLRRRLVVATIAAALIAGGVAARALQTAERLRGEAAASWRPTSWAVDSARYFFDFDGDGYSPLFGGGDCDDARADVNPEGIEIPGNGLDDNCRDGDTAPKPPWPPRPTYAALPAFVKEPKSILLITVDSLRPDHLGVHGYKRRTSPRIDAFAEGGVRFDHAYSSAPMTRIAIPVLHTGRYLGQIPWDRTTYPYPMREGVATVAEILGKERGMTTAAFISNHYLRGKWGWTRGFATIDDRVVPDPSAYKSASTSAPLAENFAAWLEQHGAERFFAWVHFFDPHHSFVSHAKDGAPDFGKRKIDLYDGEIWFTDRAVGVVLDKLDELGIAEDTMVIISADHGELFGEGGHSGHGDDLLEGGIRIPLIVRSPGLAPGVAKCIAGLVDLAPTILNFVGIDGGKYGMSGATLVPDLTGAPCDETRQTVVELRYGRLNPPSLRALIGLEWKLTYDMKQRTYVLNNLKSAAAESENLAAMHPDVFSRMQQQMNDWADVYANPELVDIVKTMTSAEAPRSARKVDAEFENGIELLAYNLGTGVFTRNEYPTVQTHWRASDRVRGECEIEFSLVDSEGTQRYVSVHPPLNGTFPVSIWPLDRVVRDGYGMELRKVCLRGKDLKNGDYGARIGLVCDGIPVAADGADVDAEGRVKAGSMTVRRSKKTSKKRRPEEGTEP